jgi:hypothetical protein
MIQNNLKIHIRMQKKLARSATLTVKPVEKVFVQFFNFFFICLTITFLWQSCLQNYFRSFFLQCEGDKLYFYFYFDGSDKFTVVFR